jgi:hypothetical protein
VKDREESTGSLILACSCFQTIGQASPNLLEADEKMKYRVNWLLLTFCRPQPEKPGNSADLLFLVSKNGTDVGKKRGREDCSFRRLRLRHAKFGGAWSQQRSW